MLSFHQKEENKILNMKFQKLILFLDILLLLMLLNFCFVLTGVENKLNIVNGTAILLKNRFYNKRTENN